MAAHGRVGRVMEAGIMYRWIAAVALFPMHALAQVAITPEATTTIVDPEVGLYATDDQSFRFADGRIVVEAGVYSLWSYDDGLTWAQGPLGPGMGLYKASIDLGDGEVLSIHRTSIKQPSGLFRATQARSFDGWATNANENATLDTPLAVEPGGDNCQLNVGAGLLFHHGLIELPDGRLMATMYGNYWTDDVPAQGYPAECLFRKFRVVTVTSADGGVTWGSPVTVAHAGLPLNTQEGFDESDIVMAPNGDLLVFMRSSGYSVPPQTPLYMARSRNLGRTWDVPVAVNAFGVNPNAVVLENGTIVLTYGGDDGWLQTSTDSGYTWGVPYRITLSESYTDVHAIGPELVLSMHYDPAANRFMASQFNVNRPFYASATTLAPGQGTKLSWAVADARNCVLKGGAWGNGASVSTALIDVATGPINAPTTYRLRCEYVSTPGVFFEHAAYVATMSFTLSQGFLSWNLPDMRNCVLSGGDWGNGVSVSTTNTGVSASAGTTYMMRCESVSSPGNYFSRVAH